MDNPLETHDQRAQFGGIPHARRRIKCCLQCKGILTALRMTKGSQCACQFVCSLVRVCAQLRCQPARLHCVHGLFHHPHAMRNLWQKFFPKPLKRRRQPA